MRFWIVLAILGFGLAVLFVNRDGGRSFGLDNDDFARLVSLLPFAAMLSVGLLLGRRRLSESLRQLGWWVLIVLALVSVYLYRDAFAQFGNRLIAGLVPGRAMVMSGPEGSEVVLNRGLGGHFSTVVTIGGVPVPMMVDTGASTIALSNRDAARIGIDTGRLRYSQPIMTANGRTMGAPIRLDDVAVGPIIRQNVQAIVAQPGSMEGSLLGMSFLSTLGSLEIRADELRLRE